MLRKNDMILPVEKVKRPSQQNRIYKARESQFLVYRHFFFLS